ncbi:Zc3h12a-like Ribonuclease NYN domain [Actinobacteria bacterium IMCC26256]|nr:Zc3h12a-like Ribonuclease NYN domain [Actinobacteria bacterium IMCC26256]
MRPEHFVIDGSNLATEGRTEPSLAQLHEAIEAIKAEHPEAILTIVVDASFEHRIDQSESKEFERIKSAGSFVSPPAGAVGRGDGFLLQIAHRTGATVLSNDSFQEFHGEYEWLFDTGRLIGGKPVPGVGWIFSLRRPVRGVTSRKAVAEKKKDGDAADGKARREVKQAIAEATADVMEPQGTRSKRRRPRRGQQPAEPINDPATFLKFVIDYRPGAEVEGTIDTFASHGAFVLVGDVRCYAPLIGLGSPPPTRARDVLAQGEVRTFVVQAIDAPRRGIELSLPEFAVPAATPSDETVAAETTSQKPQRGAIKAPAKKRPATKVTTKPVAKKTPRKKTPVKKVVAKKAVTKKVAAKKIAKRVVAVKAPAAKAAAKNSAAGKQVPKKMVPNKMVAKKIVATKKAPAKIVATKKVVTKKAVAKKLAPRTTGSSKPKGKR